MSADHTVRLCTVRWLALWIAVAFAPSCGGHAPATAPSAPPDLLASPADLRSPPADALVSPSGLRSKVLRQGRGRQRPRSFDRVSVQYTGWTERGVVFASSVTRGAPAIFRVDEAIAGWAEGLQLMVPGEKRRLWIPAGLAYEDKAEGPQGSVVIDVELLQVVEGKAPIEPPTDLASPGADVERTPSGLVHKLLRAGHGARHAAPYDRARVIYAGWSSDGRLIDSSQTVGEPVDVPVSRGFPGWREALQVLHEGEKRRFWIPEALASGHYPSTVPGTLVFDIELLQIIAMPTPPSAPKDVASAPKNALRTKTGLAYRVFQKGSGKRKPNLESTVEVQYSYWTTDGRLIDSTIPSGQPQRAELEDGDLPAGLTEAVQLMVVGEKRRLWVPERLGYSTKGRPSLGTLVFDVELLALYQGDVKVESVESQRP
jgi:FKBP-type peptidyl-prolyl cis-trans isomerase